MVVIMNMADPITAPKCLPDPGHSNQPRQVSSNSCATSRLFRFRCACSSSRSGLMAGGPPTLNLFSSSHRIA